MAPAGQPADRAPQPGGPLRPAERLHEVFDDDGVRLWYVRRSFYQMMENSSEALQKISAILPMLLDNQQKMDKRLEEIQHTQRKEQ